jgi:hypothetical protein
MLKVTLRDFVGDQRVARAEGNERRSRPEVLQIHRRTHADDEVCLGEKHGTIDDAGTGVSIGFIPKAGGLTRSRLDQRRCPRDEPLDISWDDSNAPFTRGTLGQNSHGWYRMYISHACPPHATRRRVDRRAS